MLSASVSPLLYDQQQQQQHQHQQQQQLYSLHRPGWCLVPELEKRHRDTWAGLRSRLLEADPMVTTLLQILVIIQFNVIIFEKLQNIFD